MNHFWAVEQGPASPGGIYEQPAPGELPDDFKYGVSVSECVVDIRAAFVRKFATCLVGGLVSQSPNAVSWVQEHVWAIYVPMFGTFIVVFLLWWKRHSHPWNFVLLSIFTLMEAFTLGVLVAFFNNTIVLQALLITVGIFIGLTLFTLQSKWDFSGMGPFLFAGLFGLLMTGLIGIFIPWGRTMDMFYAGGASLLFSGYIVYDTYMINSRYSPDEYIMASLSLYLE
ncbi:glutamate binding protein [Amanita rubescens]|nr:glutamate binding protein [Amanita rubescens]